MFTGKLLKESKSFYKGQSFEQAASLKFHQDTSQIPLLVSPALLRKKGMGQIDVATVSFQCVNLIEVKLNKHSVMSNYEQKKRLVFAGGFLGKLFNKNVNLSFYSGTKEKLGNHFLS